MTRRLSPTLFLAFLPAILVAAASILHPATVYAGAAAVVTAASWRGPRLTEFVPADQISSYPLVIESSGDEAEVYFPNPNPAPPGPWRRLRVSEPYPVVLMMQGASVNKNYYSLLAVSVARQGFIVVVPDQSNRLLGDAFRFAELHTITEVLEQMRLENAAMESPVYGIADTSRFAIMGHSFGGAATMFAVANWCTFPFCDETVGFVRPPELMAVVLTSSNSGSFDFDTTGIPVAIIGGSLESGRPAQLGTYETLEPPRAFITVEGATHYGMCDADVPPGSQPLEGEPPQSVPNAITASRYGYWAGTFLRAHVLKDSGAYYEIYQPAGNPEGITIVSDLWGQNKSRAKRLR